MMDKIREKLEQLQKEGWNWTELLELANLIDVEEKNSKIVIKKEEIEDQDDIVIVSNILKKMGMAVHIKGYAFIRDAILLCRENPEYINSITKKIYPGVAEKHKSTAGKVERSIRHAIEKLWDANSNSDYIEEIFKYSPKNSTRKKPTNGEFIATIVEYLKLNY